MLRDEKEKSKGVAYLSFATEAEASLALKLNGSRLDNRLIIVAVADPNKRKEKAPKRFVWVDLPSHGILLTLAILDRTQRPMQRRKGRL